MHAIGALTAAFDSSGVGNAIMTYVHGPMYPSINSTGLIVMTDVDDRIGKELAYHISEDLRMYVLGGVKGDKGKKQVTSPFTYERHKGIETIAIRSGEPQDIANTLYRIKEINRDLSRPLAGIVVSLLDLYSTHKQKAFGIDQFEDVYKSYAKNVMRIMDMGADLMVSSNANSSAGRLIVLSCKEHSYYSKGCGSSCLVKSIVEGIGRQIRADFGIAVSSIHVPCSSALSYSCEKTSLRHALMAARPQNEYLC